MLHTIILAAGKGTRMRSALPKVLHALAGKPLLQHVIEHAQALESDVVDVVVGHGADAVRNTIDDKVNFVEQTEQLGTGHAVQQTLHSIAPDATVLVLYGDVPLTPVHTLKQLIAVVDESNMAVLTVQLEDPTGYGRIVRAGNFISKIVEQKDASDAELALKEVNSGIIAVKGALLHQALPQLTNANAQGEYYLTDVIELLSKQGINVVPVSAEHPEDVEGVNSRLQLAALERAFQLKQAQKVMAAGVTLADPHRFDVRGELDVGQDCFIDINAIFIGKVSLGNNVTIEANCVIKDSQINDNTQIKAYSNIDGAIIASNVEIGPFARIRPGSELAEGAKIGNFVETKKMKLGEGSKINHLSYVGDAEVGKQVNIGAGTITCNYDGVNKSKTILGDGVFVGSNTSLVAPITVGGGATIGAGSVITKDVENNKLALTRSKQQVIEGWQRPVKKGN